MNRRDFLLSATGLALSPATVLGQEKTTPAVNGDIVFADFESGTFDGWTLTGNCWTSEPHTPTTIAGITGFQGKRFLCTLHPRLGHTATGKAVSREFTLEKPFINFFIGGGNHPGEACLNLVVDEKVVRTETGDDSPRLRRAGWDVSSLLGARAHIEIVDASRSTDRGYIIVDAIQLSPYDIYEQFLLGPNCAALEWIKSNHPVLRDWTTAKVSPYPWASTPTQIQGMIDQVVRLVQHDREWLLGDDRMNARAIGTKLKSMVNSQIERLALTDFEHQWLIGEACCQWVRQNVNYDHATRAEDNQEEWIRRNTDVSYILRSAPVRSQCWGMSVVLRDIARAAGLRCDLVSVNFRSDWSRPAPAYESRNHTIVCIVLDGGLEVPIDITSAITNGEYVTHRRESRKTATTFIMPRDYLGLAIFLLWANTKVPLAPGVKMTGDEQNVHLIGPYTYTEWARQDTLPMKHIQAEMDRWEFNGHH